MVPAPVLRSAAEQRCSQLKEAVEAKNKDASSLDGEIAEKRGEKSIAAQNTVRDLLKRKDAFQSEAKTLAAGLAIVEKALAKLQQADSLGVDWTALYAEDMQISDFVKARLEKEPGTVENLKKKVKGGSTLEYENGRLRFEGDKSILPQIKESLKGLESNYETRVSCDDDITSHILESRGEFTALSKRLSVDIAQEGNDICIYGPPESANKAADAVRGLLAGKKDFDCPKSLIGQANNRAKDIEVSTGAIIETGRFGGWSDLGIIRIRGEEDCVEEAAGKIQEWLDETESAVSEYVPSGPAKQSAKAKKAVEDEWDPETLDQLRGDLWTLSGRMNIKVKDLDNGKSIELRGAQADVDVGKKELQMMLDFYRKQAAAPATKINEPTKDELDIWGRAPKAELPVSWKW